MALKKRRVETGVTREMAGNKWLDCQHCFDSQLVDGRTTKVTCGVCLMKRAIQAA